MIKLNKRYHYASNVYIVSVDNTGRDIVNIFNVLFKLNTGTQMYIESKDARSKIKIWFSDGYIEKKISISSDKSNYQPEYIASSPQEAAAIIEKIYKLSAFQ